METRTSTRRRTVCGWWSCKARTFAHKDAMCPICRRPKVGPPEEKAR